MKLDRNIAKRQAMKIRLAQNAAEVATAQRLRYRIFYEEMGASPSSHNKAIQLDCDEFDAICDHLLVIAPNASDETTEFSLDDGELVGTYRLLQQSIAERHQGFYSQSEFDITPLLERKSELRFLELGRSCVSHEFRGTAVVELLWQGIWNYVRQHRLDVMIGCASFDGTDPGKHNEALSFLKQNVVTPSEWQVKAHQHNRVLIAARDCIDNKRIISNLPPLIKGYLRLGSYISEDAVIDHNFNTTDILVVLPISAINPRYFAKFGSPTN